MLGIREPNGRLSRRVVYAREREDMNERDAQSVVIAARMRHTGLPEAAVSLNHAGRPNAGTVHGIMCLRGDLTREQFDAAEWFIGKRAAYLRAIESPNQETGRTEGGGEFDPDKHAAFCKRAIEDWTAICDCVQTASTEHRSPIMSALDVLLVRGIHVEHLVGDARLGLNAVHRRFLAGRRQT